MKHFYITATHGRFANQMHALCNKPMFYNVPNITKQIPELGVPIHIAFDNIVVNNDDACAIA